MRRRVLLGVIASGLLAPLRAFAQQRKVYRVGFLSAESEASEHARLDALRAGLREFGYLEGADVVIEARWAEGKYDRLPALAAELARAKADVIVTAGTKATLGAKQATAITPIVMASSGDVVSLGAVASLAQPGGNITGSTNVGRELGPKRLELLKEAVPRLRRVGYLVNPANPAFGPNLQAIWEVAKKLRLEVEPVEVRGRGDFERGFAMMVNRRIDGIVLQDDTSFVVHIKEIADHAVRGRLVSAGNRGFPSSGGMIGYGPNVRVLDRRAAYFIDKILKGAKPADLPIEQASKYETAVNLRTAKALGVKLPQSILQRADEVIA